MPEARITFNLSENFISYPSLISSHVYIYLKERRRDFEKKYVLRLSKKESKSVSRSEWLKN